MTTATAGHYFYGTGRRKTAVARVRLYPGNGAIGHQRQADRRALSSPHPPTGDRRAPRRRQRAGPVQHPSEVRGRGRQRLGGRYPVGRRPGAGRSRRDLAQAPPTGRPSHSGRSHQRAQKARPQARAQGAPVHQAVRATRAAGAPPGLRPALPRRVAPWIHGSGVARVPPPDAMTPPSPCFPRADQCPAGRSGRTPPSAGKSVAAAPTLPKWRTGAGRSAQPRFARYPLPAPRPCRTSQWRWTSAWRRRSHTTPASPPARPSPRRQRSSPPSERRRRRSGQLSRGPCRRTPRRRGAPRPHTCPR